MCDSVNSDYLYGLWEFEPCYKYINYHKHQLFHQGSHNYLVKRKTNYKYMTNISLYFQKQYKKWTKKKKHFFNKLLKYILLGST